MRRDVWFSLRRPIWTRPKNGACGSDSNAGLCSTRLTSDKSFLSQKLGRQKKARYCMSGQTMYEGHGGDFPEYRYPIGKCDGLHAYPNGPLPSGGRTFESAAEEIVPCQPGDELVFAVCGDLALSSAWKSVEVCKTSGSNCPWGTWGPYTTSSGMPKRPKP